MPTPKPAPGAPAEAQAAATKSAQPYASADVIDALRLGADPQFEVLAKAKANRVKIGQVLDFKVRSSIAGYVYLLMAGTQGDDLYLLFPNARDRSNKIAANADLGLPRASWKLEFAGPPGVDRFIVVVSPTPREFTDSGWRAAEPFREFERASAAQRIRDHELSAFVGLPAGCASLRDDCARYGAAVFEVEEFQ